MQQHPNAADLHALLAKLFDAGVEFIVVGGAAAVIHGAPIITNDLDIVHRRTPENVARLLELMLHLDVKTKAGRPKDRLVLPILIATLQQRQSG
jgi:hypothetical protein